jgi:hypothetical protein
VGGGLRREAWSAEPRAERTAHPGNRIRRETEMRAAGIFDVI